MRTIYFFLLIALVASCSKEAITIETSDAGKAGVKDAYIRTTNVEVENEFEAQGKEPQIRIISPKDGGLVRGNNLTIVLNISNFRLVSHGSYPKQNEGYVQGWVDDLEFSGSKTEFVFENQSEGLHTIKAMLVSSNNTVLPYNKTIRVRISAT